MDRGGRGGGAACSGPHRRRPLTTKLDKALSITPASCWPPPVARRRSRSVHPANGKLTYGPSGTMVYTPNKGYSGTDQFQVTTSDAVKLYAVDTPPITTVGGVEIQSSAGGSAIAAVPGEHDQIYGMTDRGPNVDGRTDNEKVLPLPDFHPQIAVFGLSEGTATPGKTIILKGPDGEQLVGLVDPQANTGENLVTIDGRAAFRRRITASTPRGWLRCRTAPSGCPTNTGRSSSTSTRMAKRPERLSPFNGTLPRELSLRGPNQGMEGLTITPDGTTLVGIMQSALSHTGTRGFGEIGAARPDRHGEPADARPSRNSSTRSANPQQTKVAVSEITAISNTEFLVDERDGELQPGGNKKIYIADISDATDVGPNATVPGGVYRADAGGLQVDGKPDRDAGRRQH